MALIFAKVHGLKPLVILWFLALSGVVAGTLAPSALIARLPFDEWHLGDKIAHFIEYGLLAAISVFAFPSAPAGLWCAAAGVPLGIALEFAQNLVPGRRFEAGDILANTLGVFTGIALATGIRWCYGLL